MSIRQDRLAILVFFPRPVQSFDSTTHAPPAHLHALPLLPVLTMLGQRRIREGFQLRLQASEASV